LISSASTTRSRISTSSFASETGIRMSWTLASHGI
jgi:hypothetical protein